jgi:hypothetical protein
MLYQLSYLGISGPQAGLGAPVYSQAGRACLPRFAFGYAWRSHAEAEGEACPAQPASAKTGYL